jgi:SAM-dependent methyltransferase
MHKPHLEQAFLYWKELLRPTDTVIDATCGNGHDTLKLARLVPQGHVYAIDKQAVALEKARLLVPAGNVTFLHQSHTQLPKVRCKLVVYNLGYLPGGDKTLTTTAQTTLQSVEVATAQIEVGGAVSITCYPRHAEGEIEEKSLLAWSQGLDPLQWRVIRHVWREKCPSLIFMCKLKN